MSAITKTETRQVELSDTFETVVCDGCGVVPDVAWLRVDRDKRFWGGPKQEGWMQIRYPWPECPPGAVVSLPPAKDLCPACAAKVVGLFQGLGA